MDKISFPTMEAKRLRLRQIIPNDLHNIYKGLSNPDVVKYYGASFDTLEATQEQMAWYEDLEKNDTGIWWAICSIDHGVFYGAAGFNGISKEHRKAEIGFWLLPDFWGKGLIHETLPIICNYGFEILKLNRIEAFVDNDNKNCKSTMEKMNFKLEGTMRECETKNGLYLNVDIYSKLKSDDQDQKGVQSAFQ